MTIRGTRNQKYYPGNLPVNPESQNLMPRLLDFLRREFFSIHRGFEGVHELPELFEEPARLKAGMLVFADGTEWNPGQGRGVYFYADNTWYKFTLT